MSGFADEVSLTSREYDIYRDKNTTFIVINDNLTVLDRQAVLNQDAPEESSANFPFSITRPEFSDAAHR